MSCNCDVVSITRDAAQPQQGTISMPPLQLSDSELAAVMDAVRPIAVERRSEFSTASLPSFSPPGGRYRSR
jgi:hypothetical protein